MEKRLSYEVGKKLGRNLHAVGCALYQNKLTFRTLFKKLEGATTGPQNISWAIGKEMQNELQLTEICFLQNWTNSSRSVVDSCYAAARC